MKIVAVYTLAYHHIDMHERTHFKWQFFNQKFSSPQRGWNWKFSHLNFNRFHCGWTLRCWGRAMVSESWLNLVWGLLKFQNFKAHPWWHWIDNLKGALTSKCSNFQKNICVYWWKPKREKGQCSSVFTIHAMRMNGHFYYC